MTAASRTTEGLPSECLVCGKKVWILPSVPLGDATCPHCGHLLWFPESSPRIQDDIRRLAKLGIEVETDDEGEVRQIQFSGSRYNDHSVRTIARLTGIPVIDVRNTAMSQEGVNELRRLLPDTTIEY